MVTLWYRAPEVLLGIPVYFTPIDIWSVGCIFAEIVTKQPLFMGDSQLDQIYRIFKTLGTPDKNLWQEFRNIIDSKEWQPIYDNQKQSLSDLITSQYIDEQGMDLLKKMLVYDPCERITAKEALQHPYFYSILNND